MGAGKASVNPNAAIHLERIGQGGHPLLVIDDFLLEPQQLRQLAASSQAFAADNRDFYPGLRTPLPADYVAAWPLALTVLLRQALAQPDLSLQCLFHAFSLTTTPPQQLKPIQCIPHFDDENCHTLAMVLYLFESDLGGTGFYRHNKTGLEAITPANVSQYMKTLMAQASTEGLPAAAYSNGDSALYSRYHSVAGKYNRCVLYPSNILHSGDIKPELGLSADPLTGRLTANMALLMSHTATE